jgi:hypothetical protein
VATKRVWNHEKRNNARKAMRKQIEAVVYGSKDLGITSEEVARLLGMPRQSASSSLAYLATKNRVVVCARQWANGVRQPSRFVVPNFYEQHMHRRLTGQQMRDSELKAALLQMRADVLATIDAAGVVGIASREIAEKTGIQRKRVFVHVSQLASDGEIEPGIKERTVIGGKAVLWVKAGRLGRHKKHWEPKPAEVKETPEANTWIAQWLRKPPAKIVPAGEWTAGPIKAPRSVFDMAGQVWTQHSKAKFS